MFQVSDTVAIPVMIEAHAYGNAPGAVKHSTHDCFVRSFGPEGDPSPSKAKQVPIFPSTQSFQKSFMKECA